MDVNPIRLLYNPSLFQGSINNKSYFEGWYFKQVSSDLENVFAFIPGIALGEKERYSFIQVINGISGKTDFIPYPLEDFSFSSDKFDITVGDSRFTSDFMDINIHSENLAVRGRIDFTQKSPYPTRLFSPGIMGWYSFVPTMECKHGLISMDHLLSGSLSINGGKVDFTGGRGYIEKDWGRSFPEAWIWMQSNNFSSPGTSFMLSVAKIPWRGRFFIGFLSFLKFDNQVRFFATYNGSRIEFLRKTDSDGNGSEGVELIIRRGAESINVEAFSTCRGALRSPVSGSMDSYIKESVDAGIKVFYKGTRGLSFDDEGRRGGLEIVPEIFDYFP